MTKQPIDFWFFIGSMYTYLSGDAVRPRWTHVTGIRLRAGGRSRCSDIMIEMDNRPLSKPLKLAYMWLNSATSSVVSGMPNSYARK